MATEEDDQHMALDQPEEAEDSSSNSENGDSGDEKQDAPVEWLATSREKRSTAGNRMKSMLAAEEPDDELELLFAEDGDDAGFTDVEADGSDVQMDSSSDEEDAQANGDEDEGEKELERQARESRHAARKRKAQEAIPVKFRKKVKIITNAATSSTVTPQPRPKKKSERTSWLPATADMPTRASKRGTTMLSKEQLHQQMIEREVKRLKQVEAMERKAKKMEALKKPPMTQAQRLAEAALVEKRNAKSLNRWEEAEKRREEERRAKLAALNNRTLDGPVVTFWSGMGEWIDGKLKHVGKIITIEEKPVKKKRASAAGVEESTDSGDKDKAKDPTEKGATDTKAEVVSTTTSAEGGGSAKVAQTTEKPASPDVKDEKTSAPAPAPIQPSQPPITDNLSAPISNQSTQPQQPETASAGADEPVQDNPQQDLIYPVEKRTDTRPPEARPPEIIKAPQMKPPDMRPPGSNQYTTSMFAPTQQTQLMKPPELKAPSNSFLAPPQGLTQNGLSMPMLGYSSQVHKSSNVLAPPNTAHIQSPLSMPQTNARPPPAPTHPSRPSEQPSPAPAAARTQAPSNPFGNHKLTNANLPKKQANIAAATPPPPPSPPANGKATRNCVILQNFDENAIKEKAVQTRILFGKEMSKLGKQAAVPRCVITNHPARYKDPKTGLYYYDQKAFREIQKLQRGEYKWSRLIGAWVGGASQAARGVPARFLDPNAPRPVKTSEIKTSEIKAPEAATNVAPEEHARVKTAAPATSTGSILPTQTDGQSTSGITQPTQPTPAASNVPAVAASPVPTVSTVLTAPPLPNVAVSASPSAPPLDTATTIPAATRQ